VAGPPPTGPVTDDRPQLAGPGGAAAADPAGQVQPAATVVLVRDAGSGTEVLMLRRTSKVAFGGLWVFPGGKVEVDDLEQARRDAGAGLAQRHGSVADELAVLAARLAAVREVTEETGLTVDPGELVPLARWTPPPQAPRRYRTWFFLAVAPAGTVTVDGGEIDAHRWLAPAAALEAHRCGDIELAPPTWVTLWQLAGHGGSVTAGALVRAASTRPVQAFSTQIVADGDRVAALWEGDAGYETGALDAAGPRRRLWLAPGAWQLEWPDAAPLVGRPLRFS
jgi:8-oxo-dGTP pyrophosphatase MutT (NUDIX family)